MCHNLLDSFYLFPCTRTMINFVISIKMIVTRAIPIHVKTSVNPNADGIEKTSFSPGIIVKQ